MSRAAVFPLPRLLTRFAAASLVLGGLFAPLASHAQGLFKPPAPTLSTGTSPQAVATADFALSGFKSLVVANKNSNSIEVFLGTGTNTFNNGYTYAACRGPVAVATADFNQDGYPDIAVACPSVNTVDVFLNQGAAAPGQFGSPVSYTASDPVAMVVGTFTSGNAPGLAVAGGSGVVTVFINQSGTLVPKTATVAGTLSGIAAGDFNHDGTLDVAVSNSFGAVVQILTNDGSGNLTASGTYSVGSDPTGIVAADFNNDGNLDLAVTNSINNNVSILLGSGTGTFTSNYRQSAGIDPIGLVVTDVNNDGNPDLVVFDAQNTSSASQGAFAVLLGNGDGTLQTPQLTSLAAVPGSQAVVGDFNRDGKPDLAYALASTNQVSVALNNTLPTAYPSGRSFTPYANQPSANGNMADGITAADFNKDGLTDIAVTYLQDNAVRVMLNNGGGFGAAQTYAVGYQPYFVASGDINGDGYPDLVVSNTTTNNKVGSISVLLNNRNGTFAQAVSYPTGWLPYQVAVGDINGDGYADVVVAEYGASTAQIFWGSKSGTLTQGPALPTGINPYGVAIADLAGNGQPDVIVSCFENSQVYVFPNEGNGAFGSPVIYTSNLTKPGSIVTGDFNRDGKLDFVVSDTTGNEVTFFAGNGTNTPAAQAGIVSPLVNFPVGIAAADMNGDGILDIVGTVPNGNQIAVSLGQGDGSFGSATQIAPFSAPSQPWAIAVADFNNDGKPDVVTANTYNRVNLAVPAYINMYSKDYPAVSGGNPSVDLLLNASGTNISLAVTPNTFPLPAQNSGVQLTASVQPALSGPTPTGSVIFENSSGAPLGTAPYPLSGGSATYSTGQLGSGQYQFTALYSGDVNYQPATASGAGFAVTVAGTPVTLTLSSNTAVYGSTITATVSVQGSNGIAPQGTVTIYGNPGNFTLTPITLGANGTGSETVNITTPDFNVGTYQLYAYYTPNNGSSYQPGTSSSQQLTISPEPTSATLNCNVGFFTTTCSATITNPNTGAAIYPGRVSFSGGPAGNQSNPVNANGVATYIINSGFGGFTVTAQFPAQGNFQASNVATYNVICFFICGLDRRHEGPFHTLNSLSGLPADSGVRSVRNERIPLPLF
jgi:hypothetical protein